MKSLVKEFNSRKPSPSVSSKSTSTSSLDQDIGNIKSLGYTKGTKGTK